MGKKCIFWLVSMLLLFASPALATHIVGGEFELKHLTDNRYSLKLILYNDDINGNPGAIDALANVHIWRKRDGRLMGTYPLMLESQTPVMYNVPNCPELPVRTSKVVYEAELMLDDLNFSDPQGYYVSYERCCRNNIIDNIVSPETTGQTFYMEFPAVTRAGSRFENSSPILQPPPSDYLPVNQKFRYDVKATDPDGDRLVYRLVDPLAGFSSPEYPIPPNPMPRPYPTIVWGPGYGTQKMLQGDPALRLSDDGFLEVTPSQEGLFVFAMVVEEYRNGIKIGEVRREYQMVVYTPNNVAPLVSSSINNYEPADELELEFVLGKPISFKVRVSDEEENRLSLRAEGDGFSLSANGMSFAAVAGKGKAEGVFTWQPSCALLQNRDKITYTLYFIGEDIDVCNANQPDVLTVHLTVLQAPNQVPALTASLQGNPLPEPLLLAYGASQQPVIVDVIGRDQDLDNLLRLRLDSATAPASLYAWRDASAKGSVGSALTLQDICELLNGQPEALYTFYFSVTDDACESKTDTLSVKVLVKDHGQDFSKVHYANVFTPNNDHCNAWFEIKDLPEDACNNRFEFVRIYNRWGKLLFESLDRNFKWHGENQAAGTYYYVLRYSNYSYRSPLSLVLGHQASQNDCSNP